MLTRIDIYNRIIEHDPYNSPDYNRLDDLGTSRLFADVYNNNILFNKTIQTWFVYNGIRWEKDESDMLVDSYAKEFAIAYRQYVDNLENTVKSMNLSAEELKSELDRLKRYHNHSVLLGKRSLRKTIIDDARSYVQISQEDFDTQPNLFNCQNVVIDLDTGSVIQHSPELRLSKVANVVYDPNAMCEKYKAFMNDIMCGSQEKIRYLQVLLGYAMRGTNEREEAYVLYGKTTRNGKSTLLDTIKHLFGDYGMNIQPESLAEQKKNGRSASGDIARLCGCRLLQMSEPPKQMKLDVALLKTLTGRDKITARHLYKDEFEFSPVFKLFINTNYLPVVIDDTLFSSERIKVITFDRHFEPEEQDTGLKDALKSPESLSGILNWLLQGNRSYRNNPDAISPPDAVRRATEEYRKHSDKLIQFLDDFSDEKPSGLYKCQQLYEAYLQWCKDNNYFTDGKQSFLGEIRNKPGFRESGTIDGKTCRNVFSVEHHT